MVFQAKQIKGKGRGRELGFPTINLLTSDEISFDDGIYAAWVVIDNKPYKGALHYGKIPTFSENEKTMEVYLLDITDDNFPNTDGKIIEVDVVQHIRDVKRFLDPSDLVDQIARDVEKVSIILK